MERRRAVIVLMTVMLITLLGTAGIALPYPVLAPYFLEGEPNGLTNFLGIHPKILLGLALAIYPLGILIGSTFIGALSDIYGRRRVLIVTLMGSLIGYLITAGAMVLESYPLFIAARLVTGLCEGNISIARALAAELHPHVERTRAISLVYATTYAGWLVGPLSGGYLMPFGAAVVFLAAAGATLLCAFVAGVALTREHDREPDGASLREMVVKQNSLGLFKLDSIRPIIGYYLFFALGINTFYTFYPIWFVEQHGADSKTIAWGTVTLTATMIVSSSFAVSWLDRRLGHFRALWVAGIVLGMLLLVQPYSNGLQISIVFAAIGAFIAVGNGVVPTYLSEVFGHLGQGRVMGLQTTIFCLSSVLVAMLGSLASVFSTTLTIQVGGLLVGAAGAWLLKAPARVEEPPVLEAAGV